MKLLKITLYNLASFEGEQVIDLESEPLKSADLFSIVGETGSGKSTILDAVCLALYGLAPRFYGADNFDYYHTEKPDNNKVLEPDDPRNILRKGAKECRAEVLFLARDGFRYRAMWSCAIARVNYTRPVRRLFQLQVDADGNVGEKELEITSGSKARRGHKNVNNETLDRIIGLDYAQFTRTVMLAQNSFANFVKADDTDKAVLLEKLTGTEFYTSIARKIYAFYKQAESEYNALLEEVKAFAVHRLEEEELQVHTTRLQELEEGMKQARAELTVLEAHQQWYVELHRLKEVWLEADQDWLRAVRETEALVSQRRELHRLEEVSGVREEYLQVELLEKEIHSLSVELEKLLAEVRMQDEKTKQAQAEREQAHKDWQKDKLAWEAWVPKLTEARRLQVEWKATEEQLVKATSEWKARVERQTALQTEREKAQLSLKECCRKQEQAVSLLQDWEVHRRMLEEVSGITERLSQLYEGTVRYSSEKAHWQRTEQELQSACEAMKRLEADLSVEAQKLEALHEQVGQKQQQLAAVDMEQLQLELEEATRIYKEWEQIGLLWQTGVTLRQKRKEIQGRLETGMLQIKELEGQIGGLQQEQTEIQCLLPGLEEAYRLVSGRTAAELRAALKPEVPCPVCGSLHHPYAEGVEQVLEPVRMQLEQKRNRLLELQRVLEQVPDGLRFRLSALKGECSALATQLQEWEAHWNETSEAWKSKAVLSDELPPVLPHQEEVQQSEACTEYIHRQKEQIVERGKLLRARLSQYLSWQQELTSWRRQYDTRSKQWQERQKELHTQQTHWQQWSGKQAQKEKELVALQQMLDELRVRLQGQITYPEWEKVFQNEAVQFIADLQEMAAKYQRAQVLSQAMTAKIGECQVQITSLEKQEQTVQNEILQWQTEVHTGKEVCTRLQQAYRALVGEETPDSLEKIWKAKLTEGEKRVATLDNQQVVLQEQQNRLKGMYQSAQAQWTTKMEMLATTRQELEAFISRYNDTHPAVLVSDKEDSLNKEVADGLLTMDVLRFYFTSETHWKEVRNRIQSADEEVKLCMGRKEAHGKSWRKHWEMGVEKGWVPAVEERGPMELLSAWKEGEQEASDEAVKRLQQEAQTIQQRWDGLDKERQLVGGILAAHRQSVERMQSCQEELDRLKAVYQNWKELNDILGNANGDKFRETAQCFTLHFLVRNANEQLRMLNRRYSLEQVPDSLGIRVIDHDRADELRNISSLSGGETFLISLALALGLSSLSSRNIPMGNLFVDEGFGTLDSNSLNLVIDALSNLQSMQGKKVGVISHTAEMKERIRTQIQVVKVGSGGKSVLKIS